ncbi:hypothetical protein TNCV_533461 [Trichonephila clavipes]|nr:hypothetical protein TNCV_533461 [Trichonephila clavipes]
MALSDSLPQINLGVQSEIQRVFTKLIMSFKTFISNVRFESYQKLKEYQDTAKTLNPSTETEHSDVNKRRVISKCADKSTEKAVYRTEKFRRDTLIVLLR